MHDEVNSGTSEGGSNYSVLLDIASSDVFDSERIHSINEESLRRWGFQYSIKDRGVNQLSADELLRQYREKMKEERKRWEDIYSSISDRYAKKIELIQAELRELELNNREDDLTREDLIKQKETIGHELKEDMKRIAEVRKRMIGDKKDIVNKCMEEAGSQIDKALKIQKTAYDEVQRMNSQKFSDSAKRLTEEVERLTEKRAGFLERQAEVNKRMKVINADGINPSTAYILIGLGTSVAAAAGYFFSIFTSTANFSSQDAFFFLLSGFMKAGGDTSTGFLTKAGILVLFVLVTGMISFTCFWLFERLFRKTGKEKRNYSQFDAYSSIVRDGSGIKTDLRAGNWFSLWLQISPLIIIAGIVILVLALNGAGQSEVTDLNASLEGVFAGTAVALGVGGLVFLYIMKVIEPRLLQKQHTSNGYFGWVRYNWELAFCLLAFLLTTGAIVFYPINGKGFLLPYTNAIAVSEFMTVSLISAFSFGYGLRFRGLIAVSRFLQREIDSLDVQISELKAPNDPEFSSYYVKVNGIVQQILSAVEQRVGLLHHTSRNTSGQAAKKDDKDPGFLVKAYKGIQKALQRLARGGTGNPRSSAADYLVEMEEWEQHYFPELYEEVKLLGAEYAEKEQQHRNLTEQIDRLDSENLLITGEKREKIKKLHKDIETLQTYVGKTEISKVKLISKLDRFSVEAENAILDGFHLGAWYRENQMGPVEDYYSLTEK